MRVMLAKEDARKCKHAAIVMWGVPLPEFLAFSNPVSLMLIWRVGGKLWSGNLQP